MSQVRTRIAPSPTGFLHLGTARTALYSWAFARHHGGQFVLRIEDTDVARSTQEAVEQILDAMAWLGLDFDEGPFFQMQRLARYHEVVEQMIAAGTAYRCWCTPEELDAMREAQRARGEKTRYDGRWRPASGKRLPPVPATRPRRWACRPTTSPSSSTTGTWVSATSFAATSTSTTRPGRSISSAPWARRCRDSVTAPSSWATTGRSFPSGAARSASLPTATPATCPRPCSTTWRDWAGATWVNAHYVKLADDARLAGLVQQQLSGRNVDVADLELLARASALFKDRCSTVAELADWVEMIFVPVAPSETDLAAHVTGGVRPALRSLRDRLATIDWDKPTIAAALKETLAAHQLKMPQLAPALRVVVCGRAQTPSIDAVLALFPRATVLARLQHL